MKTAIAEGLAEVNLRILRATRAAGRSDAVKLVAVSKTHGVEAIRAAYDLGLRAFGENYAQELEAKAAALAGLPEIEWHFIGHLQTNKAKIVARHAKVVHTVDSAVLARELDKRVQREGKDPVSVLIEVNVAREPQKHGTPPEELADVIDAVDRCAALRLSGLMTMPPAGDLAAARSVFDTLRTLRNLHGGAARLPELSMGMSDDLEVAIASGATVVRVGTAIFGPRGSVGR